MVDLNYDIVWEKHCDDKNEKLYVAQTFAGKG